MLLNLIKIFLISYKAADSNQGKIGDTIIAVEMFESSAIATGWKDIFEIGG